ncbi:hypothetical protein [Cerasicoccus maritimus]|uniref:hypothetical protein n=1 Tax=Cerasicoccus maritimus TaxID=490089 RepID=UPI0028528F8F|nr:hypothetical protein [Cerasicoccus maritimus]
MKKNEYQMRIATISCLLITLLGIAGCSRPKVDEMKAGLIKSGMPAAQADCFANEMKKSVDADPYNYMAALMNAGADEKTAINKARRKYGAEFKAPLEEARDACTE